MRSIASEEIWNINMLDTTLNQIHYCRDAKRFQNPDDANFLVEILRGLLKKLKGILTVSKKIYDYAHDRALASNHVWYNEVFFSNMFITANLQQVHILYSAFDVPNFIKSIEPYMTEYSTSFLSGQKYELLSLIVNQIKNKLLNFSMS